MRISTGHKRLAALDEQTWRSVKAPCAACQGTGLGTIYFDRGQAIHLPDAPRCGWCGGTGIRSVHCGAPHSTTWEYDAERRPEEPHTKRPGW
jgi:hypothetical protein